MTQVARAIAAWGMDPTKGPYRLYSILRDGEWHTSSELHAAYNRDADVMMGWSWDGAKAQLVKKGFVIESERVEGRREYRHRLTHYPDGRALKPDQTPLAAAIARTYDEIERREAERSDGGAANTLAHDPPEPSQGPGRRPSPSRWQNQVGVSGAARQKERGWF